MKTIDQVVSKHYEKLMGEVIEIVGDDIYDVVIYVKTMGGFTTRASWRESQERLRREEENAK